ncbi:MAG: hypothetical protein AAGA19_12105 [Pseudomonadota bacterium]
MGPFLKGIFLVLAMTALAGCEEFSFTTGGGVGVGNQPSSKLVVLESDGSVPDEGFSTTGTRGSGENLVTENGRTSGFAYQYGRVSGTNRFLGVAGVAPNTDAGTVPTTATATYEGTYDLAYISNTVERKDGDITLDANFVAGTLTGSADGLNVDGVISGTTVSGEASYRGVNASMDGVIGTKRAVAAFAGNTSRDVLVGGIVAAPQ